RRVRRDRGAGDHARQLPGPPRCGHAVTATTEVARPSKSELSAEVRAWLADHWDPDLSVDEWWRIVAAGGWTAPHFAPELGGRGLPPSASNTVRAVFADFGALRPPGGLGLLMSAPTIVA